MVLVVLWFPLRPEHGESDGLEAYVGMQFQGLGKKDGYGCSRR